jgi:hypothetical protein
MTGTRHAAGGVALSAALAILKETVGPLKHREGGGNVTAGQLAGIIARETRMPALLAAIGEALAEIEDCQDMLLEYERSHPVGNDWARIYDKLAAVRDLLKGRAE